MVNQVAPPGDVVLVTGGCGFLGRHVIRMLLEKGQNVAEIRVFDLQAPTDILIATDSESDHHVHVTYIQGDIRDLDALQEAVKGVGSVLHVAAALDTGLEADFEHLHSINVQGTENIIRACQEAAVEHLIYTSTSEVLRGFHPRVHVSEVDVDTVHIRNSTDLVFPAYSLTKKLAEDSVLAANGRRLPNGKHLRTLSLRPCGVYGEGDVMFVTGFLRTGKSVGVLPILGSSNVKVSKVYAGNVAWAHVHALNTMRVRNDDVISTSTIYGKAYHVTDGTSKENNFLWAKPYLETHRIKVLPLAIPLWIIFYFWIILEAFVYVLGPVIRIPLAANRNELFLAGTTSTYDGSRARSLLGYIPLYSAKEAYDRSIGYYSKLKF